MLFLYEEHKVLKAHLLLLLVYRPRKDQKFEGKKKPWAIKHYTCQSATNVFRANLSMGLIMTNPHSISSMKSKVIMTMGQHVIGGFLDMYDGYFSDQNHRTGRCVSIYLG